MADCLSQPLSQAGIRYAVTGVCHQTSNRILHPAGAITVNGCRGYAWSVSLFGHYGLGSWPEKLTCYSGGTSTGGGGADKPPDALKGFKELSEDDASNYATGMTDPEATRESELSWLIQTALGHPLDIITFERLNAAHAKLRATQTQLMSQLDSGRLTPADYLLALDNATGTWTAQSREILGVQRHATVFGDAEMTATDLIDVDVFLSQQSSPLSQR